MLEGAGMKPSSYSTVATKHYNSVGMTYQRPGDDNSSRNSVDIEATYELSGNGKEENDSGCSVGLRDDVDYGYNKASSAGSVDGFSTDFDEIERQQEEEDRLKAIFLARLRKVIMLGIFLLILATCGAVYAFGVSRKIMAYRSRFRSHGVKVIDSMQGSLYQKVAVLDSLSATLTLLAESENQEWPFVTLANADAVLSHHSNLLGDSVVIICPIVQSSQQIEWESYASNEIDRINSSRREVLSMERRTKKSKDKHDDEKPETIPTPVPITPSPSFYPPFDPEDSVVSPSSSPTTGGDLQTTSPSSFPIKHNAVESQEDEREFNAAIQVENPEAKHRFPAFAVAWQYFPVLATSSLKNMDRAALSDHEDVAKVMIGAERVSAQLHNIPGAKTKSNFTDILLESIRDKTRSKQDSEDALLELLFPIQGGVAKFQEPVGLVSSTVEFSSIIRGASAAEDLPGLVVVVNFKQDIIMAYEVEQDSVRLTTVPRMAAIGGDLFLESSLLLEDSNSGSDRRLQSSDLSIEVYPLHPGRGSWRPIVAILIMVALVVFLTLLMVMFHFFTYLVSEQHDRAIDRIAKADALMSSLFPAKIKKRMMHEMERSGTPQAINVRRGSLFGTEISIGSGLSRQTGISRRSPGGASRRGSMCSRRQSLDSLFSRRGSTGAGANRKHPNDAVHGNGRRSSVGRRMSINSSEGSAGKMTLDSIIADFHPETSIIFMDIKGFTAWCSEREPAQVFTLLESIYNSFDVIASKRGVFKVETIGDCYMAVCGLPEPKEDHAVAMCEFARECLKKMKGLCKDLEIFLGPGTAALNLRIGIHSGPAVAGVLRTGNARFQLFGDSVNTASRMESTGLAGRVQISVQTASELTKYGFEDWFWPREEVVYAKGIGEVQTYWLDLFDRFDPLPTNALNESCNIIREKTETEDDTTSEALALSDENELLINWVVERLSQLLKKIETWHTMQVFELASADLVIDVDDTCVIGEVQEVIKFMGIEGAEYKDVEEIVAVDPRVISQLKDLVKEIARNYKNNAFHNLAHASHVAMSVVKLLSRISILKKNPSLGPAHAIASDPLVQFALVFASLIHDVGHPGVSNSQLVKENDPLAVKYSGRSVTESNSIQIAWKILMKGKYKDLRRAIFCNEVEMQRFRHLIVNLVVATDLFDPRLQKTRETLWTEAFEDNSEELSIAGVDDDHLDVERQATQIIDFLMQASDLSHMMQHFQTYLKWNERLFEEQVDAFQCGRLEKDPSLGWYAGELAFFDNYVIPLAKKLKDCAVFGVSSDEYLQFAEANRKEWETRGRDTVDEWQLKYM